MHHSVQLLLLGPERHNTVEGMIQFIQSESNAELLLYEPSVDAAEG